MSQPTLTQIQLAKEIGVSTRTLQRWEHKADFPRKPTPANVAEWRAAQKRPEREELEELKCQKLQQEIEIGELRAAKLRREQMSIAAVDALSRLIGQKLSLLLRQKVEVELPGRVLGKPIAEINVECAQVADEIREIVNGNLADYATISTDD